MTEHHYEHPTIVPIPPALRRGVLSGAGVGADDLAGLLGCDAKVIRTIRASLGRDPDDGQPQPPASPAAPGHEELDHLMRSNRGAL